MSGLALVRAAAPDSLSKSIQYGLSDTASYVKERTSATFQPLGGQIYNPQQGTRLIRFVISDGRAFLDPSTVALNFRLRNVAGAGNLKLRGPPITLFQRIRILIKGTVVEDLHEVPHLATLLRYCDSEERQRNEAILSNWDDREGDIVGEAMVMSGAGVPPNLGRRMMTDLRVCGMFRIDKHIPLFATAGITIELTLAEGVDAFYANTQADHPLVDGDNAAVPRSQQYALEDVCLQCDLLTMSPELISRYDGLLDEGNNFPISFTTFATTRHQVGAANDQDIQTTRSLSLLKTVFLTFSSANAAYLNNTFGPKFGAWNTFINPMQAAAAAMTDVNDTISWQLHIGGHVWPVQPVRGQGAETWYHLRQALDISNFGFNNWTARDWATYKWLLGIDTEKAAGALDNLSFTGYSVRSGEPVTLRFRGLNNGANINTAFLTLCHDAFVTLSRASCDINY